MKVAVKAVLSVIALLLMAGCCERRADEYNNEVVLAYAGVHSRGDGVMCFEWEDPQTPEIRDVLVLSSGGILQVYRLEGRAVTQYYFPTDRDYRRDTSGKEDYAAFLAFRQLPNILKPDSILPRVSGEHPIVAIIDMHTLAPDHLTPSPNVLVWDDWWKVRKWVGVTNDVPPVIATYYQYYIQTTALPENQRSYLSYLRAVPLLTKEELDKEKDTPIIDVEKARYHAQRAIYKPYVLFPIPEKKSPFPAVRKYTPGDKFKVKFRDEYFLIETFAGGKEK